MAEIRPIREPKTELEKTPDTVSAEDKQLAASIRDEDAVHSSEQIVVPSNGETVVLPLEIESNHAEKLVALGVFLALCYFGKVVLATIMFSLLLAFSLEPIVEMLQRIRVPRSLAALIALGVLGAALYAVSYFSYVRASDF